MLPVETEVPSEVVVNLAPPLCRQLVCDVHPLEVEAMARSRGGVEMQRVQHPADDLWVRHDEDAAGVEQHGIDIGQHPFRMPRR